jgi:septal ring factor EnvC (AmiA/AmiB activator)
MPVGRARRFAWVVAAALLSASVSADELDVRRAELEQVQRRIQEVERVIARAEGERSGAAAELARAERAVSAASRQLSETAERLADTVKTLKEREREAESIARRIAERNEELALWLRRQYLHGGNEVAPVLAARDPNQLARDLRYLEYLGRARVELIESLRTDLEAQKVVLANIAVERERLVALEAEQRARQAAIENTRRARAEAVERVSAQLRGQQREAESLRQSEAQLGEVVEVLAAAAAAREEARRQMMAAREATAASARVPLSTRPAAARPGASAEPVRGVARDTAGPTPTGIRFSQLRGNIGFPVRGELIGRFGAPRAEGGTRWRGIFIRASEGEQVVAVAPGEVVFSDWLRGYGNLLIIEHDDDYLTIYGNNDALLRVVGDRIVAGSPIASVGTSGGGQGSGLYFEIRHKGQPVDPMQWIRSR